MCSLTKKEPKNTDNDWGAPEKLPLKRHMRRWLGVVTFIVALHLVLGYLFSIPLVRHYAFIGRILYDSTIGQVWRETREAMQDRNRQLSLPKSHYATVSLDQDYTGYSVIAARDSIVWIDDETVLFTGRKGTLPKNTIDVPNIYKWNISETIALYQENAQTECFADNKLLFWRHDRSAPAEKQMIYYYGEPGHEIRVDDFARADKISCRPLTKDDIKSHKWRSGFRLPLREGDGFITYKFITITHPEPDSPLTFEKTNGTIINLPINNSEHMSGILIKYYPYKNSYLLSPIANTQKSSQRLWWIYPDGKAESVPAPRMLAYGNMYSTRAGLVYSGYANQNSEKRSLFLAKSDGSIEQLMKDDVRVEDIAVSPNGCKIAFFAFNMIRQYRNFGPWVYSVDFCQPATMEK